MELALGAILLVLMYEKPYALTEMANSLLGKAVMIIGVGIIAKNNGLASGLLAALIMIILIHETVEGMTTKKADAEPDYKKLGYTQINDESAVKNALKKAGITKGTLRNLDDPSQPSGSPTYHPGINEVSKKR